MENKMSDLNKIWDNWSEILTHYESLASQIPYCEFMPKPKKNDDESNASYGARLDEYLKIMAEKKIRDNENQKARNEIYSEMEKEIFKYFEVEWDDKKTQKAWSIAWENGHSSGYNDVVNYFEELVELIK